MKTALSSNRKPHRHIVTAAIKYSLSYSASENIQFDGAK